MANLLLVDSDERFLERAVSVLVEHAIVTATNGVQAVLLYCNNPVDILVIEVDVPGLDGVSVYKLLSSLHEVVTVIFTVNEPQAVTLGDEQLTLIRPVDLDRLKSKIDDIVCGRTKTGSHTSPETETINEKLTRLKGSISDTLKAIKGKTKSRSTLYEQVPLPVHEFLLNRPIGRFRCRPRFL
jgi:DNA-binding response OmpR family regulator